MKAARAADDRSRAVYKLEEIQRTDKIISAGATIVDLGAVPRGWSQIAARLMLSRGHVQGRIIASDILPMDVIPGVEFVQGDFFKDDVFQALVALVGKAQLQLVMSDMAPNMTGIADVDHLRGMYLVEISLDFAEKVLAPRATSWSKFSRAGIISLSSNG